MVLAMTLPMTIGFAAYSHDLIGVMLGPKWTAAAPIFRLLAPTVLVFAVINPLSWLLLSTGKVVRSLQIALAMTPLLVVAYFIGLPHGPEGVAFGFSAMMVLLAVPIVAWAFHGTMFSLNDFAKAAGPPFISAAVASGISLGIKSLFGPSLSPFLRLVLGGGALAGAYLAMLLFVMGQKEFYLGLVRELRSRKAAE